MVPAGEIHLDLLRFYSSCRAHRVSLLGEAKEICICLPGVWMHAILLMAGRPALSARPTINPATQSFLQSSLSEIHADNAKTFHTQ